MNVDLDKLLCLIDGKITFYRMKNNDLYIESELIKIQREIQKLYDKNINNKGVVKKWIIKYYVFK